MSGDDGNAAVNLAPGSVFTNKSTIDISMAAAPNDTSGTNGFQRTRLYGVSGSDEGDYQVFNFGTITATHSGVGRLWGVAANGDTTSMETTNDGTIQITRGALTLSAVTATSLKGRASALASGNENIDVAGAVYSEEEVESETITNNAKGKIKATGQLTAAIFSRAGEATIVNDGQIIQTTPTEGFAIAKVSNAGEVRTLDMTNNGTITGDILVVGGQAQRWWALSNGLATSGGIDSRLNINSQFGESDSTITNTHKINGNIYYGNGEHVLTNTKNATLKGDIDVDQRLQTVTGLSCEVGDDECYAKPVTTGTKLLGGPGEEEINLNSATTVTTGGGIGDTITYTMNMWGAKSFTFNNAGTYIGNLTVETQAAGTVDTFDYGDSHVTLQPHIFGGGGASAGAAGGVGTIGLIQGQLKIADGISNGTSSIARTTNIAPVYDGIVKNGEWYTVATSLFGNDVPTVDPTALVSWTAQKAGGALVIESAVKDASTIAGISPIGATVINTLIAAGGPGTDAGLNALGGAVEQLTDDSDVAKAGKQLSPEVNFATQQSAITLNNAIGQHIDTRLDAVGATGGYQGYTPGPSGLGMKPSESDPNRSNLGGGIKDEGDDFVAPRSAALWGQAFGASMNQDQRSQVDGYGAELYGIITGYDNWIAPNLRVGIAGGYANTQIDGDGDTKANSTSIDSYLVEAYGAFKGDGWYATGRTGFTWHDYDTTRVVTVVPAESARGNHDGDQFNVALEVGVPIKQAGLIVTPVAGVTYSNLHQDGYTEVSDGGMALAVGSQSNDSLVSSLGLKGLVPVDTRTVVEGRALWLHEFADDAQVVTASFAAGGGTFTAAGPGVGRDTADLGIGMLAQIGSNSTFELNYDANVREAYLAHIGSARIDVHF